MERVKYVIMAAGCVYLGLIGLAIAGLIIASTKALCSNIWKRITNNERIPVFYLSRAIVFSAALAVAVFVNPWAGAAALVAGIIAVPNSVRRSK